MKHQYFADINDYRKYGILRALLEGSNLRLGVAWMLTPDDGSTDGEFRAYLNQPRKHRHHDPELFDALGRLLGGEHHRNVGHARDWQLLPRATFLDALVPDNRAGRALYQAELLRLASDSDVVFLDPDNGCEVKSRPAGRKGSSKFVLWDEISALLSAGRSLVIYQHFPRVKREVFLAGVAAEMARRVPEVSVECLVTAHVAFLVVVQPEHAECLQRGISLVESRWQGQIRRASPVTA